MDTSSSQGKFNTSVCGKPTFTGLFTNFHVLLNVLLIHRIFNLCTSYENFHIQLEVVRNLFKLNGFPSHMFKWVVRRFFDNTFHPKPSVQTVPKKIMYFCLPLTGTHSLRLRIQINCRLNPFISIPGLFSVLPHECLLFSRIKLPKCRCCSASYVGQTTRHLHTKVSEHLGISPITGKRSLCSSPPP